MLFVCADAVPMSKSNIYFREYYNITQVRYITSLAPNQVRVGIYCVRVVGL